MMPEDSTRRCSKTVFVCWSPPPMKPRPVDSSPTPMTLPDQGTDQEPPMSSESVPLRPPLTRDAAGTLLGQTMGLVAVTAALFAVGAYLGRNLASPWGWLLFIAAFGCLIAMNAAVQRSEGLAVALLFGFGLLMGVATAPTLSYYASADPQAVWQAGAATALF